MIVKGQGIGASLLPVWLNLRIFQGCNDFKWHSIIYRYFSLENSTQLGENGKNTALGFMSSVTTSEQQGKETSRRMGWKARLYGPPVQYIR